MSFITVGSPAGMLHAGCGASTVRSFLSTLNIPPPDAKTLKRRERESGSFVEVAAKRAFVVVWFCGEIIQKNAQCSKTNTVTLVFFRSSFSKVYKIPLVKRLKKL